MWPGLLCARLPCPGCAQKLNSVPLWGVCLCTWMGWTRYGVLIDFPSLQVIFKNYFQALCVAMTMMLMAGQM